MKFHGVERRSLAAEIETADIVLTTYNTLTRDFHTKGAPSILHRLEWYRVVLDEGPIRGTIPYDRLTFLAHIIRHKGTTFNKAVSELNAKSRWCLSGTPIQNKLDDIGALFAYILIQSLLGEALTER